MDTSETAPATTPANAQSVLVLQGGGALGSYQAGAFQALCRAGFEPEWVAGISIGAINSAIIAGNEPAKRVDRLKEFWDMVSSPVSWNPIGSGDRARTLFNETSAALIATFGVPGFFTPRLPPAPMFGPWMPKAWLRMPDRECSMHCGMMCGDALQAPWSRYLRIISEQRVRPK